MKASTQTSVCEAVEDCVRRLRKSVSQRGRRQKAELYAHGLRAKWTQADLALRKLSELSTVSDETQTGTSPDALSVTAQVEFYGDAFWAFLYSTLDVLGQLLNQAMDLRLDEKNVCFKSVLKEIGRTHPRTPLCSAMSKCRKSHAFKNLENYRNCSIHRRQVFVREETKFIRSTPGYRSSTGSAFSSVRRVLCDNPLALKPALKQGREIPQYMKDVQEKIGHHIVEILKILPDVSS